MAICGDKMTDIKLISPSKEYEKEAFEYIQEFIEYNSEINGTGGLDVWKGTDIEYKIDAIICIVDLMKKDS